MHKLRTILVDDERAGRARLRRMLEREPDVEIVAELGDGPAAVAALQQQTPDLLFLDISMPQMDGFEVLAALTPAQQPPAVIFVTAYDEHALRAFDACALDYLLKPASPERLAKSLGRARERIGQVLSTPPAIPPVAGDGAGVKRFVVRSGWKVSFVAPAEIDWVEAAGNYAILHVGDQQHMLRETMAALESQLSADKFLRVSRSAILNLRRVRELCASPSGETAALLAGGHRVHVTRRLREVAWHLSQVTAADRLEPQHHPFA